MDDCLQWAQLLDYFGGLFVVFNIRRSYTTRRFVLSAVFVYRLAMLYCFFYNLDLWIGFKALLKVT